MSRIYRKDNAVWKKNFGAILKSLFSQYNLDYRSFAKQYNWSESTVRYWFSGRSCPRDGLPDIKNYFYNNIPSSSPHHEKLYEEIKGLFDKQGAIVTYYELRKYYQSMEIFAGEVLETCCAFAKNEKLIEDYNEEIQSTGKTQAVVFDFDGTLTIGDSNKTTWERIWVNLGYDVKCCQELHRQFIRNEISHAEWCKITESCFRNRHLHRSMIEELSSKIRLIKGTKKTFKELYQRDIKIYIVSGSIMTIIRSVLHPVYQYVDGIKANEFHFGEDGLLKEIVGTKYDFGGKETYISELSRELKISPRDILFVGDSVNDQSAYKSGARTLCVNPKLTDVSNSAIWNNYILPCRDLIEIMEFV